MSGLPATAIVLAGGRSARFGADKLAAQVDGRPLLHHAIAAVDGVVREIVVVLAPDGAEPPLPAGVKASVRFARDAADGQGPLAGLAAGLAAATEPLALVVGGDQPRLVPALLREMLRLVAPGAGGQPVDGVALEDEGRIRPLPAALRVAAARPAAARALDVGVASLIGFLGGLPLGMLPPERWRLFDPAGDSLRDVDRPGDLPGSQADGPA